MSGWIWFALVVPLPAAVGLFVLFRSLRRWKQPPPRSPEQIRAEMQLFAESRQPDRW